MTRIRTTFLVLLTIAAVAAGPALAADAFEPVMEPYGVIHQALAGDTLDGVPTAAKSLADELRELEKEMTAEEAGVEAAELADVRSRVADAAAAADRLAKAEDLVAARTAFGELSDALVTWRNLAGSGPAVGFCPMAKKPWLEADTETLENPYYGESMLRCGSFQAK